MNYFVEGRRGVLARVCTIASDALVSPIGSDVMYTLCRTANLGVSVAGVWLNVVDSDIPILAIPLNVKGLVPTPSAQVVKPNEWVVLWCDSQMLCDQAADVDSEMEPNVR